MNYHFQQGLLGKKKLWCIVKEKFWNHQIMEIKVNKMK